MCKSLVKCMRDFLWDRWMKGQALIWIVKRLINQGGLEIGDLRICFNSLVGHVGLAFRPQACSLMASNHCEGT